VNGDVDRAEADAADGLGDLLKHVALTQTTTSTCRSGRLRASGLRRTFWQRGHNP
jgi:hypothetical protein